MKFTISNSIIVGLYFANLAFGDCVQAQTVVVVNKANPVVNLAKAQLLAIYLGDEIVWENQNRIYPVTLTTNQSITKTFFEKGLRKKVERVKRIWVKLSLSGKTSPPKILNSVAQVVEYISQNEGAIGFIPVEKLDERVKTIKIDGKTYNEKKYIFSQKTE